MSDKTMRGGSFIGSADDFLKFNRGGAGWLENWKDDGKINVIIHPATGFWSRNFHALARLSMKDDKEVVKYWPFVCWEPISNIVAMKRGISEPFDCPMDKLIKIVRNMVDNGELGLDDIVLVIGEGMSDVREITAGSFLKSNDKRRKKDNFKGDPNLKLEYIFGVIDYDHPDKGVQLTNESQGLGSAVQDAISAKIQGDGEDAGNPMVTPWVMQWQYNSKSIRPADYYKCIAMNRLVLTAEHRDAVALAGKKEACLDAVSVRDEDLYLLHNILSKGLRVNVNVDDLFDTLTSELAHGEELFKSNGTNTSNNKSIGGNKPSTGANRPGGNKPSTPNKPTGANRPGGNKPSISSKPTWPSGMIPCPNKTCGKPIKPNESICPHCKAALVTCWYSLANKAEIEDGGVKLIIDCGKSMVEGSNICLHCGGRYDRLEQTGVTYNIAGLHADGWSKYDKTASKNTTDADKKEANGEIEMIICPACNTSVKPNADLTCPECGTSLDNGDDIPF